MARSILVVEDDADISWNMQRLLEGEGFKVFIAKHGAAALEYLADQDARPDAILLDLMMPVMDGWEFRKRQLEDHMLKLIPVIVLSASGQNSRAIDADAILKKPIDLAALFSTIETVFAKNA